VLEAMGVIVLRCDAAADVIPTVSAALTMAFQSARGAGCCLDNVSSAPRNSHRRRGMARPKKLQVTAPTPCWTGDVIPLLIEKPEEFLVVAGLAGSAQELTAITKDGPTFTLAGAMGPRSRWA
jgi:hypothetical protein